MQNNTQIIKLLFLFLFTIILGICITALSSDENSIKSIALCLIPFSVVGLFFIKEKIWYLWFLCPAMLLPLGTISTYKYLIIYSLTLPIYCWFIFRKKINPIWNSVPIIDIPIIILILYVIHTFLSNPFGIGLDFFEDYYGGRGYLTILGASIAFLLLSSLNTTSKQLGKLLNWSIPILIFFTVITTIKGYLIKTEDAIVTAEQITSGEGERESALLGISILILQLLIIKYTIKDFLLKIWPSLLALGGCIGILISGFRSAVMSVVILFGIVCILYKRWMPLALIPLISIFALTILSTNGYLRELPYGIQRSLAPIEFLDVDPNIRIAATGSIDWRTQMWDWALDDRELFIKDKIWGDGFSQDVYTKKAETYFLARNMHERGDSMGNLKFAWDGQWHNAPISFINCLGFIGLSIYIILSLISIYYCWIVSKIFKNSHYRIGILVITLPHIETSLTFPIATADASILVPNLIVTLTITKLLYCCAKREGLYIPKSTRKEYIPMVCRQENSEPA